MGDWVLYDAQYNCAQLVSLLLWWGGKRCVGEGKINTPAVRQGLGMEQTLLSQGRAGHRRRWLPPLHTAGLGAACLVAPLVTPIAAPTASPGSVQGGWGQGCAGLCSGWVEGGTGSENYALLLLALPGCGKHWTEQLRCLRTSSTQ